jgi:hypothetical protein
VASACSPLATRRLATAILGRQDQLETVCPGAHRAPEAGTSPAEVGSPTLLPIQTFHGLPVRDRSVKTDETSALRDFLYGLSRNRPRSPTSPRPVGVTSWSPLLIFKTPSHPFPGAFKPSGPTQAKPAGTEMEALLRSVRVPHAGAVAGHRPGGFGFLPGYHLPSCPNSCRT